MNMHQEINVVGETVSLNEHAECAVDSVFSDIGNSSSFPFPIDERFKYLAHLGRGGSGLIFQAWDQKLQRNVALKFLINANALNRASLVAEARAQANVEHAFICPVYEVVESAHGVYLVMQFVEGQTLQTLAPALSLERLLALFSNIAQGLQAAHAQGVIHRDFKPGNIVVNTKRGLVPQIVDFGLAQQQYCELANTCSSQNLAGTQGFIAPELTISSLQQSQKVDRRVDIYAFGATLHFCLLGKLNSVKSDAELVQRLAQSHLPKDIQIIIAKCMAISPAARYSSVKMIANEIDRYLNGEPIKSRPGKGYWLQRKLKKHRWLMLAVSVALTGISGMYINQLYQAHLQSIREQALLAFNGQLNALENDAQLTFMSPRHNIERKLNEWQAQAQRLESQLATTPEVLKNATYYAIGRIYVVLGNNELAIAHLNRAVTDKNQPDAPFYLALAYGELYRQTLEKLRNIPNEKTRLSRIAALDATLKAPAVNLLTHHITSAPYQSYSRALLAYYQQDWDEALRMLDQKVPNVSNSSISNSSTSNTASQQPALPPWFYRDDMLKADILMSKAVALHETGGDMAGVFELMAQSNEIIRHTMNIAPSDPTLALKPVSSKLFRLIVLNQAGIAANDQELAAIELDVVQALRIQANNAELFQTHGEALRMYGLNLHYNNGNPQSTFTAAETQLNKALELDKHDDSKWFSLARLYTSVAKHQRESNQNAQPTIMQAIDALNKISPEHHDYHYFNQLGTLHRYRAQHLAKQGQNEQAGAFFASAIANYISANQHTPQNVGSLINAASTLRKQSETDPPPKRLLALRKAQKWLNQVVAKEPNHFVANYYLAVIGVDLVELALYRGLTVNGLTVNGGLEAASAQMQKVKQVNSEHPYILDLEQKLRQFELERVFSEYQRWQDEFDTLIANRRELAARFANNSLVTRNYVGVLAGVTAYRIQLGLPADMHVKALQQAVKTYSNIEQAEAYQALAELFSHWDSPNLPSLNLIEKYQLRHKQSFAHQWALYMVLIATASEQAHWQEGIALAEQDKGMLPTYRAMVINWAQARAAASKQ